MLEEAEYAANFMELYATPEQLAASAPRPVPPFLGSPPPTQVPHPGIRLFLSLPAFYLDHASSCLQCVLSRGKSSKTLNP